MKLHKIFNLLLVFCFVIGISIPIIFVNKEPGKISTAENRVLASFPSLKKNSSYNRNFVSEFESWFNDNLGFRNELVAANTVFQYNLFGKITRPDTVLGKNDWLYLMYPEMIKSYQNMNPLTDERYSQIAEKFIGLKKYFDVKDIPFITMVNPDKETIYPENMPDTYLRKDNETKVDTIVKNLSEKDNIDIFYTKDSLLRSKKDATLYSQNYDLSHWNSYGAFIAYLELMNKIKEYQPGVKILSFNDFSVEPYIRESKLYGVLPFKETDYKFTYKKTYSATQETGSFDDLNLISNNLAFKYVNKTNDKLPKLLIIGDSYIYSFMLNNIAESFSEVNFVHWFNMGSVKGLVNIYKPDLILLEFMEPALEQFTDSISYPDGYFNEYEAYKDLPVVASQDGSMWLDTVNKKLVESQTGIILEKEDQFFKLTGWALDKNAGKTAADVYLKINDKYYNGYYGIGRSSVSDYFGNPQLINSGFTFNINKDDIINANKVSLVIVSNDRSYQYAPIDININWK
ncbi:hypothetical protein P40081_34465 [Paenibacillus sp. FSL P4-0081]|jgi:alginate O-acetyltransferase complex protein AlgJ|uniref:alginate O-acetyltransferase AlgX-related protein n=1 Tax=Paenibacillus sp. FSL P4-0081 TaxID=1536769 RepID=UPI0004F6848C|nr:hypothetical protein [Paenibacillus sp. FSL P4-0081]AIQ32634.1 hypothetical protein P40081_34465 [Paenibacillus sp. FSL P4-0081]